MLRGMPPYKIVLIAGIWLLAATVPATVLVLANPEISWSAETPARLTAAEPTGAASSIDSTSGPVRPLYQTVFAPLPAAGTLTPDRFSGAYIEATSELDGGRSMVTIFVPGGAAGMFRASISGWGEFSYPCSTLRENGTRLYCTGTRFPRGVELVLILYQVTAENQEVAVFQASFFVPITASQSTEPSAFGDGRIAPSTPSRTPTLAPTSTSAPLPSATLTLTDTPVPPPTETPVPAPTETPVPPPTETPVPPPTETPIPPPTETPTDVPMPSETPI